MRKFVSYIRVSTVQQGRSGLGQEAQEAAVRAYLVSVGGALVGRFEEVESAKGADALDRRPQLRAALAVCKKLGAGLLIAKLDRLARNVHFVTGLLESGVDFVAADMPGASKTMIQMHSVMAEWERDQISARTKAALAAAKARDVRLGKAGGRNMRALNAVRQKAADAFASNLKGLIDGFYLRNLSQRRMVIELNTLRIAAPRGGVWSLSQVQSLLARQARPTAS